jgi:hypothetical protein
MPPDTCPPLWTVEPPDVRRFNVSGATWHDWLDRTQEIVGALLRPGRRGSAVAGQRRPGRRRFSGALTLRQPEWHHMVVHSAGLHLTLTGPERANLKHGRSNEDRQAQPGSTCIDRDPSGRHDDGDGAGRVRRGRRRPATLSRSGAVSQHMCPTWPPGRDPRRHTARRRRTAWACEAGTRGCRCRRSG